MEKQINIIKRLLAKRIIEISKDVSEWKQIWIIDKTFIEPIKIEMERLEQISEGARSKIISLLLDDDFKIKNNKIIYDSNIKYIEVK